MTSEKLTAAVHTAPRIPLFVASRSLIRQLLPALKVVRKEEWQTVYVNTATSEQWVQFPLWDYHGPGPDCLRRGGPTVDDILACIEQSQDDAEVSAAAYFLVNDVHASKENYEPLIVKLEQLATESGDKRVLRNVALAIAWSKVDVPFNHRNPDGKTIQAVNADYEHFVALASRASTLMAKVREVLGYSVSQQTTSFE